MKELCVHLAKIKKHVDLLDHRDAFSADDRRSCTILFAGPSCKSACG
jgi:hypothetical protein